MIIKIGDLTIRQKLKYCNDRDVCQGCKLSYGWHFPECMCQDSQYLDIEVELPDVYFEESKDNAR